MRRSYWAFVCLAAALAAAAVGPVRAQDAPADLVAAKKELARLKAEVAKLKAEVARLKAELAKEKAEAAKARAMFNLREICKASQLWMIKFGGTMVYPTALEDLWKSKIVKNAKLFIHPFNGSKPVKGQFVSDYDSAFDRAGFSVSESAYPASALLAWEARPRFKGGRVVVYANARAAFISEAKFQEQLKELEVIIKKCKPKIKRDAWGNVRRGK